MNPSVLVVEDDPTLNRLLVKELRKAGYELDSASSWQEARERIAAFAPNLVLLDVNLPDATGFGPLSEIAGTRPIHSKLYDAKSGPINSSSSWI